jgi:CheY-like chemotaxis protein
VTKVLYIEDNDDNVYMLKMRLELLGDFEVLAAEDGQKGCEMATTEQPDIILMDLEMPIVDGWEATRRLKGNPRHPRYRSFRTCTRRRTRKGARRGVQRVRHQADRIRPAGRDHAACSRAPQVKTASRVRRQRNCNRPLLLESCHARLVPGNPHAFVISKGMDSRSLARGITAIQNN